MGFHRVNKKWGTMFHMFHSESSLAKAMYLTSRAVEPMVEINTRAYNYVNCQCQT